MPVDASLRTATSWVLAAFTALVPLVFARGALQPIITPKVVAVLVGGAVLLGMTVAAMVRARQVAVPSSPVTITAVLLFVVMLVTATRSEGTWPVLWGPVDRGSGLLLYLALLIVLLATPPLLDVVGVRRVIHAMLAAAGVVTAYAALQGIGVDPLGWRTDFPQVATLGNPNFVSALLGIAVPLAAYTALRAELASRVRVGAGVLAVAAFAVAAWTGSVQGPIAAGGGLGLLLVVWLVDRGGARARAAAGGVIALGAVGVVAIVAGLAGVGPASFLATQAAIGPRLFYWEAALGMLRDASVLGQGFAMYPSYYRTYRPEGAAEEHGLDLTNDAAHSVPLEMLAQGGILLGLAYAAFVIAVAFVLARGVLGASGDRRLLLGGLGGAWLAYQAQSVVSIDVPPLALWHWVLAGLIVVVAGPVGSWAVPREPTSARGRAWQQRRGVSQLLGVALGAVLTVAALAPLWADHLAGEASARVEAGDVPGAREAINGATSVVPGRPDYWIIAAQAELGMGNEQGALDRFRDAISADPRDWPAAANAGRTADRLDAPEADELWEHARAIEPQADEYREEAE
ncbi:hypothetical protein ER308_15435 [Egibacter rhizosphaerae]|uniref:O-antigen ligase-related domain-containing protein n=1 Tax=Egibacter rhizosphaerae TaxID=1670831 RepID=A0A411YHY0_9ACTN|nr:O-antigen ligase family protein [Egibacter rhizosphaerae]QBI20823.1 hypothetical protein ER308_15435 [Egibacter rhizosphaerae]